MKKYSPLLRVSIAGSPGTARPASFTLVTDAALPSVMAELSYPSTVLEGAAGEDIIVSLLDGSNEDIYFTGTIYDTAVRGSRRVLYLTDGYKKLCDSRVTPSYRKETAAAILSDTLDAAGITSRTITCPAVEIARFASDTITADRCIALLIKTLEEYGFQSLRYFFDARNYFRFGTREDTGVNAGPVFALEVGDNILRRGHGYVEILPMPIRHSQRVSVNGVSWTVSRTDLAVSQNRSRLRIWGAA